MEQMTIPHLVDRSHTIRKTEGVHRYWLRVYHMEMYVFIQLTKDLMGEMLNNTEARPYRVDLLVAFESFNQFRKKLLRIVGEEGLAAMEDEVCEVVDSSEANVTWVRNMIKSQMVNKIRWQQVEMAVLIGMIGGFISIVAQVYNAIFQRKSTDLENVYRNIKHIDKSIGFEALNENTSVDFACCRGAMEKMFRDIRKKCEQRDIQDNDIRTEKEN